MVETEKQNNTRTKQMNNEETLVPQGDPSAPQDQDPLSGAATGWEAPKYPNLAPDRLYEFEIKAVSKEKVKGHEDRDQLKITLVTIKDYTDTDGKPLRAGFKGFTYVGLYALPEADSAREKTMKDVGKELAKIQRCVFGPQASQHEPKELRDNPESIVGKIVTMKVGMGKASAKYPDPSNTFRWVEPA